MCRYNVDGFVRSYPDLLERRNLHACASFGNEASHFDLMLRLSLLHDLFFFSVFLFVEKKQIWDFIFFPFDSTANTSSHILVVGLLKGKQTKKQSMDNGHLCQKSSNPCSSFYQKSSSHSTA